MRCSVCEISGYRDISDTFTSILLENKNRILRLQIRITISKSSFSRKFREQFPRQRREEEEIFFAQIISTLGR